MQQKYQFSSVSEFYDDYAKKKSKAKVVISKCNRKWITLFTFHNSPNMEYLSIIPVKVTQIR